MPKSTQCTLKINIDGNTHTIKYPSVLSAKNAVNDWKKLSGVKVKFKATGKAA